MKIVGIISGKGGVGKSTLALSLTHALNTHGREAILIDGNLMHPHIGLMLGKSSFDETSHSITVQKGSLKKAVYKHQCGIRLIPGDINLEHLYKKDVNMLKDHLKELETLTELLIIDLGDGFSLDTQALVNCCDSLIVVSTPDFIAVTESLRMIKFLRQKKKEILGVVLNRVKKGKFELSHENIQTLLEEKIIGSLGESAHIAEALHTKYPVTYTHPDSPIARAYDALACSLIGKKVEYPQQQVKKETFLEKIGLKQWYDSLFEEDDE